MRKEEDLAMSSTCLVVFFWSGDGSFGDFPQGHQWERGRKEGMKGGMRRWRVIEGGDGERRGARKPLQCIVRLSAHRRGRQRENPPF